MALSDLIGSGPGGPVAFPPTESLLLKLLRPLGDELDGVTFGSSIPDGVQLPFVFVHRESGAFANDSFGTATGSLWMDRCVVKIDVFTRGPNANIQGFELQDIIRRRLMYAHQKQLVVEGYGHIGYMRTSSPPHLSSDWASSTGVVQYARLPKDAQRYEATYGLVIRPDQKNPRNPTLALGS